MKNTRSQEMKKILEEKTSQRKSEEYRRTGYLRTNLKTQMQLGNRKATKCAGRKKFSERKFRFTTKNHKRISSIRSPVRSLPDFRERNGSLRIIIFYSMDIIITIIWYHLKKKGNAGLGFRDFIFLVSSGRQEHLDSVSS